MEAIRTIRTTGPKNFEQVSIKDLEFSKKKAFGMIFASFCTSFKPATGK